MAQGTLLGARAAVEFPGATRIAAVDWTEAERETCAALQGGAGVLLEPAFRSGSLVARPDILARERGAQWRLWEVKAGTEARQEYLIDVAFQVLVLEGNGLRVRPGLFLVDREAAFESPSIFRRVDCEEEARAILPAVEDASHRLSELLRGGEPPNASLEPRCRDCDLRSACWPDLPSPCVLDLYQGRGGWRNVRVLLERGVTDLGDIPADANLTQLQRRQLDAMRSGTSVVDGKARDDLRRVARHPLHFVDFEAARFPIPEFPGQHPYDLLPFQWSCHVREAAGAPLRHFEYLRETPGDPRREFAENLLSRIGPQGSVIVYSNFEQDTIRDLAASFPDLAARFESVGHRIVDLPPILRGHYYHPGFGGSFSIKAVLPVLAPGLSYEAMPIGDGQEAVWAYDRLAHEELAPEERARIVTDLRAYCEQDSLALARIYDVIAGDGEAEAGRGRTGG
jgi:predicted RecB family nuclease